MPNWTFISSSRQPAAAKNSPDPAVVLQQIAAAYSLEELELILELAHNPARKIAIDYLTKNLKKT
jgi:hypothetical protein